MYILKFILFFYIIYHKVILENIITYKYRSNCKYTIYIFISINFIKNINKNLKILKYRYIIYNYCIYIIYKLYFYYTT